MESSDQIYYLRQLLKRDARSMAFSSNVQETGFTAHFYVKAADATDAGGAAGTFCLEQGLACMEYICLPQPILPSQIGAHEDEYRKAYELAMQRGIAMVASIVLT